LNFIFNETGIALLVFLFSALGVMATIAAERFSDFTVDFIGVIKEDVNGIYSELKKVKIGATQEQVNFGEAQFVVDTSRTTGRAHWNRWGGLHPVLEFDVRDGKSLFRQDGKEVEVPDEVKAKGKKEVERWMKKENVKKETVRGKPLFVKYTRDPKPSSHTVNLLFRRGGLKAMMEATKHVSMDPRFVAVMVAIAALAGGYVLFSFIHPGLVQAAPPGYYYKAVPYPTNTTIVTG
jgi:hypothetical protein